MRSLAPRLAGEAGSKALSRRKFVHDSSAYQRYPSAYGRYRQYHLPTATISMPRPSDCRRRGAHAADQCAGARRRTRRARFPQGRNVAAHRLVQIPRRLQQDFGDPCGAARCRRGGLFVRQSRARRGGGGGAPRHARDHRDAERRAESETRAHAGTWRRDRVPTTARPRIARRSRKRIIAERGATLVPPYDDPLIIAGQGTIGCRDRRGSRRGFRLEARDRGRRASGGGLAAGISLGVKSRVPRRSSIPPSRKASTTLRALSRAASAKPIRA